MSQFPYIFFNEFVFRSPTFSHQNFVRKLTGPHLSDQDFNNVCSDSAFQEAIHLASPDLYNELTQYLCASRKVHSNQRFRNSIIKYYSRMSSRCTPFGLFAAVGIGKFTTDQCQPSLQNTIIRDTKLDMLFLASLAKTLESNKKIKEKLLYFPNNSIYKVGKRIRYVEYNFVNNKREYIISSAELTGELSAIIHFSKNGRTIKEISDFLMEPEISYDEARQFVDELIENQVLVSILEPNVSGKDYLDSIISILKSVEAKEELHILLEIKNKLNDVDQNTGNTKQTYEVIENLIKTLVKDYDKKYLFQTDSYLDGDFSLQENHQKDIERGIRFLNKITAKNREIYLDIFKKQFSERFGTREMPLSYIMDTEIGIGYGPQTSQGIHEYLDDINIFSKKKKDQNFHCILSPFQMLLNEKVQDAMRNNHFTINISDQDLDELNDNWHDLPPTISVMAEYLSIENCRKLFISSCGGSSATQLLGRFCSEKSKVHHFTKEIADKEEELQNNHLVAEIIHLPESRVGNVIRRPHLRNYEIPYLAQSVLPESQQIPIEDLLVSVKDDKVILRSKKLNREVMPYLSNAHNYENNTLPLYNFICDLQAQGCRKALYFDWGGLNTLYKFLPRVEYENIIVSKAKWKITHKDSHPMEHLMDNAGKLLAEFGSWRSSHQIPQWVQWVKSDHILPFNLENYDMVKLFLTTVKSEKSIQIEEYLYDRNDEFKREFIFALHRKK